MSGARVAVAAVAGFVLHAYPYKETSLLVEVLTAAYGRVALVAKGARRPRSELRGLLQAFQPLIFAWSGRGEVKSLTAAEWAGGIPRLAGEALLCGFYANELVLKLLAREDPHPRLYEHYDLALRALAGGQDRAAVLRRFELALLAELGYGMELGREADTGVPIVAERRYHYIVDRGPVAAESSGPDAGIDVAGSTLLALSRGDLSDARAAAEAKLLMREVLNRHLENRSVFSRRLMQDLIELSDGGARRQ